MRTVYAAADFEPPTEPVIKPEPSPEAKFRELEALIAELNPKEQQILRPALESHMGIPMAQLDKTYAQVFARDKNAVGINIDVFLMAKPNVTPDSEVTEKGNSICDGRQLAPEGPPGTHEEGVVDKAKEVVTSPVMTVAKLATPIFRSRLNQYSSEKRCTPGKP